MFFCYGESIMAEETARKVRDKNMKSEVKI
jgi:hypothetical protein